MFPVLFSFGPFQIHSFGLMVALGLILSIFLMTRRARRDGFPRPEDVSDLVMGTVLAGLLGARIHYVIQEWAVYAAHPLQVFVLWEGGLIFYGGQAAAVAALVFMFRRKGIPFFKGLDFMIPYAAMVHGFGRIGCFLNGCCGGRVCDLPWAVQFPGEISRVHPAQIYEAVWDFGLFFFLSRLLGRRQFDGQITWIYFLLYGAGRLTVEFFREGNPVMGVFTVNQWISAALMIVSGSAYFLMKRRSRTAGEK